MAVRHSIKRNRHEEPCRDKDERSWTYFESGYWAPFPVGMVESEQSTDKTKYRVKIMKTKAENKWAANFQLFYLSPQSYKER